MMLIEDDVAAMIRHAVEQFGRLDCLVNNAGSGSQRAAADAVPLRAPGDCSGWLRPQ